LILIDPLSISMQSLSPVNVRAVLVLSGNLPYLFIFFFLISVLQVWKIYTIEKKRCPEFDSN
jgi:hypothetical protein